MESDLFKKLCFGVKFSKQTSHARLKNAAEPEPEAVESDVKVTVGAETAPQQTQGTSSRKRKKRKKTQGKEQRAQEVNALKKRLRIHTDGDNVPEPAVQFQALGERYGLQQHILRNVTRMGFTEPTPVQMQAVPIMIEKRDIMVGAPTGSGKTAAFVLPILHHLQAPSNQGFRALILTPTRELAAQTLQVCRQLSEGIGFCCHYIDKPSKAIKFKPGAKKNFDILVSTPNRLVYLLKHDPPLIDLSRVQWLVVDESDKLFEDGESGFQDQLAVIDNACSAQDLRHAFFSATFSHDVKTFCQSTMPDIVQLTVGARNTATHLIKQELLFVGSEAGKRMAMRNLIREGLTPPVLVFVQSKQRAKELYSEIMYDGIKVDVIHADRPQAERNATVCSFQEGRVWVLICTELMGRGIDFRGVNLVINYDFPTNAVNYIHRIGRTGRAGVPGRAVTFFTEQDSTHLRSIANIMKESGCEVPDYMLHLKKPSKRDKKKKFPVKRKRISTELHEPVKRRRKLSSEPSPQQKSDNKSGKKKTPAKLRKPGKQSSLERKKKRTTKP